MEVRMAKEKLEVSLKPVAIEIDKAERELRSLKRRVSQDDLGKIAKELKDLVAIRKLVVRACGRRMTRAFVPKPEEE
jgi:predicted RNA-binding protein YlqC (UPF0109 family)